MAGPITGYRTAKNIFKTVSNILDIIKNTDDVTQLRIPEDKLTLMEANGSIIKLLTPYIIEPSVIVTNTLKDVRETEKIMDLSVDMFTAFYTQVFNVLVNVHGMDGKVVFDLLSSKRHFGVESYPILDSMMKEELTILPLDVLSVSNEATKSNHTTSKTWNNMTDKEKLTMRNTVLKNVINDAKKKRRKGKELTYEEETLIELSKRKRDKKTSDQLTQTIHNNIQAKVKSGYEITELERMILNGASVNTTEPTPTDRKIRTRTSGKKSFESPSVIHKEIELSYEVNTKSGTYTVEIPITVKANIIYTDYDQIANVLDNNSDRTSFFNRLEEYRSGGITLSELILAKDIIDDYRIARFKDSSEILKDIENRSTSANLNIFSSGTVGLDKFYGIILMTKYEQTQVERQIRGKLDNGKYRDIFLTSMKSMIVVTLDTDWEMLKIYIKDIRGTSTISFKSLGKDKKDTDMSEMFKALVANKSPI